MALMLSMASIGEPVHWIVEPFSMTNRLLMMFCSEKRKLPSVMV